MDGVGWLGGGCIHISHHARPPHTHTLTMPPPPYAHEQPHTHTQTGAFVPVVKSLRKEDGAGQVLPAADASPFNKR